MAKLHIKKGDTVFVLAGDDKGKTGRVLSVDAQKNRAIVEGINMVSKSTKPNAKNPQDIYACVTYNRHGKNHCTQHRVEFDTLYNVVLDEINSELSMYISKVDTLK